eukprot:16451828-Heterocapsa_arctica.AAC.1
MIVKGGWEVNIVDKNMPMKTISGCMGDNLLKNSENMAWWSGMDIEYGKKTIHCDQIDKAAPKQKGKEKKQKYIITKFIFQKPDRRSRATK